uniref:Nuclease SbcCD subunit D n=1 Tax=Caldimicrobium thiodismutans TaxID=1653476 RepID=A0A832LVG0_9BACT
MRLLLTSDWHLGKNLYQQKLLSKQAKFFLETFIPLLRDLSPDALLVAGDILDKPIPDQETLFFFEEFLKELASLKIPSFFILGNHDSRRTALHKYFLELAFIYIVDDLRFFLQPFKLKTEKGEGLNLYLLPYLPAFELLEKIPPLKQGLTSWHSITLREILVYLLERMELERPAFLMGHFALERGIFSGEEINLRGLSNDYLLPAELFLSFDALLLGHLHRSQVHQGKFIYPGAPLPYAFETYGEERGVLLLEVKERTIQHQELIPLSPTYELKLLQGTFETLMSLPPTKAFVKILLEDEEPIYQVHQKLKTKFPNILYLDYVRNQGEISKEVYSYEEPVVEEMKFDERELFKEFYFFLEKREPEERVWKVFETYLEEFYKKEREEGRLCQ